MSRKTFHIIITTLLICALIVFAALIVIPKLKNASTSSSDRSTEQGNQEGISAEIPPVLVSAQPSHRGDLIIRISASGQTEAIRQISIIPKISGEIVALPIYEGKFVKQGDILMKLDDREYQLSFNDDRQKLLKARSEFEVQKLDRKTLNQLVDSSAVNRSERLEQQWNSAQQQYRNGEIDEASYQKIWLEYQSAQILRGVRHEEMVASHIGFSPAISDEDQKIALQDYFENNNFYHNE